MTHFAIVRAACWLILVISLLALVVLLDVYRIERQAGERRSMLIITIVATGVVAVAALFAKCAWTGCLPGAMQ